MVYPDLNDALVNEIAEGYKESRSRYDRTAKDWTRWYAIWNTDALTTRPGSALQAAEWGLGFGQIPSDVRFHASQTFILDVSCVDA